MNSTKSIRVIGASLSLAAYFVMHFAVYYFQFVAGENAFVASTAQANVHFGLAIDAISPNTAAALGIRYVPAAVYVLACLGAAFFVVGVFYDAAEIALLRGVSATASLLRHAAVRASGWPGRRADDAGASQQAL